jgi:hypothetical protein
MCLVGNLSSLLQYNSDEVGTQVMIVHLKSQCCTRNH